MKQTWFALLLLILPSPQASAVTFLLQPDGSGDFPTIQEAVDASSDGDSILLADGTYKPIIYPGITTWGKAITICSQSGDPTRCLIDATYSYGFNISQGEGRDTIVEGLTVMNGVGQDGGGFHIKATSPTIRNCIIRDCFSPVSGGGIKAYNGSNPLIEDCHIYGNLAGTTTVGGGGGRQV